MKITIPEPVAEGALEALRESKHPDVRHLVRQLNEHVSSRRQAQEGTVLSVDELEAVMKAVDAVLTLLGVVEGPGTWSLPLKMTIATEQQLADAQGRLRTARPKLERIKARQQLRERGGK